METKVSFPSMGWSKIAFEALYKPIPGIEIVYPPDVNQEIIRLGAKYSPEFVCFPFKVTLGEFLYMIIHQDVHTFVMSIDCGPCRLGFYAPIQERIIKDLGYDVKIVPIQQDDLWNFKFLESFYALTTVKGKIMRHWDIIQGIRFTYMKAIYIEQIMRYEGLIRCREINHGDTTKTVKNLMNSLRNEWSTVNLHQFDRKIIKEFRKIHIKRNVQPLRIMIAGENHVVLEHFVNMDMLRKFGEAGIEVHLGNSLYGWIIHKNHLNFKRKLLERISKPYIPLDIGGEAIWVIGHYLECQKNGFDGFIHLYPFTCMPENSAKGILEGQSPDPFYLPIQFYSLDEHTGFEGMRTRLEAFIDLMSANRENNPRFQGKYQQPSEIEKIYNNQEKYLHLNQFAEDILNPVCNSLMLLINSA
ncbi:MAG: hypothetical protein ACTSWL_06565, partial [Promethearchaeota archaeon]